MKYIIPNAQDKSRNKFNIEDGIHVRQIIAHKLTDHLNHEERERVRLNLTGIDKWIGHYKKLWYNSNVPQEAAEDRRQVKGVFNNV